MNLTVSDSRKLLIKLVGTTNGVAWEERGNGFTKSLQSAFRPLISTAVKTHLSASIKNSSIDLLEIDSHLEDLSSALLKQICPGFEEYGLTIPQFYITNIVLPESDPNFKRLRELHTINLQTRMISAETIIKTAQADAEAEVIAARRRAEMERQETATEIAKREAERELIRAQTEAQASKMAGFAEAEVMRAQGYNQKDIIQAEVQKAYAEGLGNMTITGGVAGDMVGLGVGLAAAGKIGSQVNEMFKGFDAPTPVGTTETAVCAKCGATIPQNAKFCLECGEKVVSATPADMVVCPNCGNTVAKGKFCPECGHKFMTNCPQCNAPLTPGAKFCMECGTKI